MQPIVMQPAWVSLALSIALAIIAVSTTFALLRFRTEAQEKQVIEVKVEIKELKHDFNNFKDEIRRELSMLSTAVKLASTEQGAVNKIITEGMSAMMRAVEKMESRVHELETQDVKSNQRTILSGLDSVR